MPTLNKDTSIVDYLKSTGQDFSLANRTKLGSQYGIDYSKTTDNYATQNVALLNKLKSLNAQAGTNVVPPVDYSKVGSIPDANAVINSGQTTDVNNATVSGAPPVKKTTADYMKEITGIVTPSTPAPVKSDFVGDVNAYRSEYGITTLETQLDDLRAQEQELLATKSSRTAAERGKTVAMNVIEGRVGEVERQENERIGVVQRAISNATNQLNTKYNIVNTLMKAKEMDYDSAVSIYDKQTSNNISMFNAAKGLEEADKTEIERQADNARSNAQIVINTMSDRGMTYDQLSPAEQTNLTKMGVQSGLGADFFSNAMKVGGGKNILTTVVSADDTKATIIYKDGTTKVISTGLTEIKDQQMSADRQTIMADVGKITGEDRKVNPEKMIALRQDIALNNPELLSWFDNAYVPKDMLNPTNYPRAVRENQWGTK